MEYTLHVWPKSYADARQQQQDIINLALHDHAAGKPCNCLFTYPCPGCGGEFTLTGPQLATVGADQLCEDCELLAVLAGGGGL